MTPSPYLRYRYPPRLVARASWAWLCQRRRPFAADAAVLYRTLDPTPEAEGLEHIPASGAILAFNHYRSRAFPAMWGPIAITGLIDAHRSLGPDGISWVMTEAWTYPDPLRQHVGTPLTRWVFRRLAHVYGLVTMPPMPPRTHEVEARARAVREALALARQAGPAFIGLSPEGHDSPGATLMVPPSGVGRFLLLLAARRPVLPIGICEDGGRLQVRFGPSFPLQVPTDLPASRRDAWATSEVMLAIGRLLPSALWGAYGELLQAASSHTCSGNTSYTSTLC